MENTALQLFVSTIKNDGDDIYIKPVCDFFKIDTENQVLKIKNDPILTNCYGKNSNKTMFGDNYLRFCLNKKGFIRWIQLLNPNIIDSNLRDSFFMYQEMVFDFLYGAAEEQMMIGNLNTQLQTLKSEYSLIGNKIRITQRELFDALNKRYQYSIPFDTQNQIT